MIDHDLLASAKSGKKRRGQKQLIAYLSGKTLTRQESILARCYDCDCMGDSGQCTLRSCALHPYSPYGGRSKKLGRLSGPSLEEINSHAHAGGAMGTKETILNEDLDAEYDKKHN